MLFVGNGRHRRRTQAEKVIAVAGVAGVGLAMPLLAATGAQAAPVSVWDKVAQCESGGNWSINSGNGYYGGLQFSQSTWKSFGGGAYAAQAHQASKGQQIAVAEKVLASQGPGAWPVCSRKAGLAKGGPAAQADTADSSSGSSSDSSSDFRPAAATAPKAAQPKAAQPQAPSKPARQSAADPDEEAGRAPDFGGRSGWDADDKVFWYQDNGDWYWTSHQSVYEHFAPAARTAQAAPAPAPAPAAAGPAAYTVRPGDTLGTIAGAQGVAGGWGALYDGNRSVVGADPDLIIPGQVLNLG
jgi:hypothetical protein